MQTPTDIPRNLLLAMVLASGHPATAQTAWPPKVFMFFPTSGAAGTSVMVFGMGFEGATQVEVGATATTFIAKNGFLLTLQVPAGAETGPITVRTPAGTATSASNFTVTTPSPAGPSITSFNPLEGPVGTVVTLLGSGFTAGTSVSFNGMAATRVTLVSASKLQASVPAGATTGPIIVTTVAGTASSATNFTVVTAPAAGPSISSFTPTQGPVGTPVTLSGAHFTAGAKVSFNGVAAAQVAYASASQIKAVVPAGATTGPITVTTAAGSAVSSVNFSVSGTPPPASMDYSIGGWYLTQSVQTLARAIPLVAGRDGYLRVFTVANGNNHAAPPVRVTITGGSPSPWVQTIPAPGTSVPTALNEGALGTSWNLQVPGAVLAPGGTIKLELDPDRTQPDPNRSNNVVQANLDVRSVKPFHISIIPITQQGLTGNVTGGGRTLASWVDRLQRMYPLANLAGGVDVQEGSAYTTQANLNSGPDGWSQLLNEIESKRVAEGSSRYYLGAVNVSYSGGTSGIGSIGAPSAACWDKSGYPDGGNYPEVLAHEVGHNFGREHAPCDVNDPDPDWPTDAAHANAKVGVYSFDRATKALVAPTTEDIMSYCHPNWVSDYTYKGVLAFRNSSPVGLVAALPRTQCLLVSGRLRRGKLELNPAYTIRTQPLIPDGEEFVLDLLDAAGATLLRVPFSPHGLADLPGSDERQFTFAIPLERRIELSLQDLRVWSGSRVVAVRRGGVGGPPRPPSAVVSGPKKIHLEWDAQATPTTMVRNPADAQVLAFGEGGALDLDSDLTTLEVILSNGVVAYPFMVKVTADRGQDPVQHPDGSHDSRNL